MKTILIPTDFSDAAEYAAEYAANLSKDLNANVVLLHVYHFPTPVSELPVMVIAPDELQKENELLLQNKVNELKEKTGVEAHYIAKMGLAVDEIMEEAQGADLIVMGMRGAGKLSETLLGSITTAILRKTQTPMLIIPSKASYKRPETIVFASDYDPKTNMEMNILKEFRNVFNSKIFVLNVKQKKESVSVEEAIAGVRLENKLNEIEHVYYFPEKEDLVEGINEFVKDHHADIVAIIPHHYSLLERLFHKSISKSMAFHTNVPLLALPDRGR
jgi:nucleotide-binding universal stress UspA family protein